MNVHMADYFVSETKDAFTVKIWRGERAFLLGFDVGSPEPDFIGFAIEYQTPKNRGTEKFARMGNRMTFEYRESVDEAVTGGDRSDSLSTPFQTFRWVDVSRFPTQGIWT